MAQYPAATTTVTPNRLITKADTAGQTNLTATGVVTAAASTTPGAWVQLTASSSAEYLLVGFQYQTTTLQNTTMARSDLPIVVDIGTGGAGSETVKATGAAGDVASDGTNVNASGIYNFAIPLRISSGTRIAVRAAKSAANVSSAVTGTVNVFVVPYANVEGN